MKILVTGSRGWCGLGMIPVLLDHGHEIVGLDISPLPQDYEPTANHRELQGDIQDMGCLVSAMAGCQAIVHAAVAHFYQQTTYPVPGCPDKTLLYDNFLAHRANITGSFNILEIAQQSGIRQIVVLSSSAVIYDHIIGQDGKTVHIHKVDASTPPRYHYFYGFIKHMQEQLSLRYARDAGMSVTILRPWRIVDGPSYRNKQGGSLHGDNAPLSPTSMVCRTDLGEVSHLALKHPEITYEIFYPVAGPWADRFFDVAYLKKQLGWQPRYTFAELPICYQDQIK